MRWRSVALFLFNLGLAYLLGVTVGVKIAPATAQDKPALERPRPLSPEKAALTGPGPEPNEDQLYVWPLPEKGTQSLLVLRVLDGDTMECAYLVPVMVRIRGVNAPELTASGGRDAREALDKLAGGKLLPANLHGREKFGRVLADFWLGKDKGWVSQALIKGGFAKPYDGGKRE
jgi:endonuclease YncB( thermonuclease family)